MNFCQISNLFGLFPVIYALQHRLYWAAGIISTAVLFSLIYHTDEDNEMALHVDMFGCSLMVAASAYIYMQSDTVVTTGNILTLIFASAAITCYILSGEDTHTEQYRVWHTGWHVFVFYGTCTFLHSYVHTTIRPSNRVMAKPLKPVINRTINRTVSGLRSGINRYLRRGGPKGTGSATGSVTSSVTGSVTSTGVVQCEGEAGVEAVAPEYTGNNLANIRVCIRRPGTYDICKRYRDWQIRENGRSVINAIAGPRVIQF